MGQSKKQSLIETTLNVFSGWLIATLMWLYVLAPYFGVELQLQENLQITTLFTIISIIRGYIWRRVFNYFGERLG
jgi:hypothetical protein